MNEWLQDFAYRINIGMVGICVAGISAFLIALVTISFQAIRAAIANPVKSLTNRIKSRPSGRQFCGPNKN